MRRNKNEKFWVGLQTQEWCWEWWRSTRSEEPVELPGAGIQWKGSAEEWDGEESRDAATSHKMGVETEQWVWKQKTEQWVWKQSSHSTDPAAQGGNVPTSSISPLKFQMHNFQILTQNFYSKLGAMRENIIRKHGKCISSLFLIWNI